MGNLVSAKGAGKAAEEERDEQARLEQEARDRYNRNVGAQLWTGQAPPPEFYGAPTDRPTGTGMFSSIMNTQPNPMQLNLPQSGQVAQGMLYQQPTIGLSKMPMYNPYYFRG